MLCGSATQDRPFTPTDTHRGPFVRMGVEILSNPRWQAVVHKRWIRGLGLTDGMVGHYRLQKMDLGVWDGRLRGFNIIALAEMGKSVYKVKD